jgi:hypothetical protein
LWCETLGSILPRPALTKRHEVHRQIVDCSPELVGYRHGYVADGHQRFAEAT